MKHVGGHSMTAPLKRVLVCSPETAGWGRAESSWRDLGYFHPPEAKRAEEQHRKLVGALESVGAEVHFLPAGDGMTLDAVYAHDASFPTDRGMILMHMGKEARRSESGRHEAFYESLEISILGRIDPPGLTEGGDILWLDESTVLIGDGYRTNPEGIEQVRALLAPLDVEVIAAPLPHGPGPSACLHLMSLVSLLDEKVAIVDLSWLSVPTIRLLEKRGFHLIPMPAEERESLACNVLALGNKKLLALEENERTNELLEREGFEVLTFPGSEVSANGSGGPTCLTRPFLRG